MEERNNLYPVFLKLRNLKILIVGGGFVAEEQLYSIYNSSTDANVTMVASYFRVGTIALAKQYGVKMIERPFKPSDLNDHQIIICTTDDDLLNIDIYAICKKIGIMVSVVNNLTYCDFYMGGIVTKGNLKIAISTNGKSTSTTKLLKQLFDDIIPNDINDLLRNIRKYRKSLKADFSGKVNRLNKLTIDLIKKAK